MILKTSVRTVLKSLRVFSLGMRLEADRQKLQFNKNYLKVFCYSQILKNHSKIGRMLSNSKSPFYHDS